MATLVAFHGQSMECSRREYGERVSGALKWDYLANGVNRDRKSMVLKQEVGLGLRLTSNNFEVETPDAPQDDDLKKGGWRRRAWDRREWKNVLGAAGVQTGL
jgi:hypothetical protein